MSLRALHGVPAPAKLNLFLHVVGRRTDGYHLLQSVFVLIDWADELHFERRADGALARHDLGPALPADDLILRAARGLRQATGCTLGADVHVDKRVPWGAGMGGGSSDAASTLLALNRLWSLDLPRARLAEIGLALGADVPFFIGGENAFVEGIGEKLTPLALPPMRFMVLKPAAAIEARAVFGHPMLRRDSAALILAGSSQDHAAQQARPVAVQVGGTVGVEELADPAFGRNDLQPAAEALSAEVTEALRWLNAGSGAHIWARLGTSRMTGSGSAVFARVDSDAGTLPNLPAGWVARQCRSLTHHPLRDWVE
jgi:4-diphosphocytidyl-2-C-methyl-D-erythritol kinase